MKACLAKLLLIATFLLASVSFAQNQCAVGLFQVAQVALSPTEAAERILVDKKKDILSRFLFDRYIAKWKPEKVFTPGQFERNIKESLFILALMRLEIPKPQWPSLGSVQEKQITSWAERTLMTEGLRGFLRLEPVNPTWGQKVQIWWSRMTQGPLLKGLFTLVTFNLPEMKNKPMPPELLAQIVEDGISAHEQELRQVYNSSQQGGVDFYNRVVRSAFGTFAVVASLVTAVPAIQEAQTQVAQAEERAQEAQFEQLMEELDRIEADLNEAP